MTALSKQHIRDLIEQKENRDAHQISKNEQRFMKTDEIFHKIKNKVLTVCIEDAIKYNYAISEIVVDWAIDKILRDSLGITSVEYLCHLHRTEGLNFDRKEVDDYLKCVDDQKSINKSYLVSNLKKYLLSNGFEKDHFKGYKTSKQRLLGD